MPGRHGQHAVVVVTLGRALPALGEGERLAVELAVHPRAGELADPGAQRELPPRRDVDRRHRLAVAGDRPGRPDADARHTRTSWRSAASSCCSTIVASALKWPSGPTFWSTSTTARSSSSPRGVTSPAANLVPPMSTARTTGGSRRGAASAPSPRGRRRRRTGGDQGVRVRSYPNDLSGGLGFAHDRATCDPGTPGGVRGFMFPRSATGRSSLVPPPPWHYSGQMLTIEYRTDPAAVAELLPPPLEPADRGSRRRGRDLGRLAELQRHVRGAARPGARAVPRDVRRRALHLPRRGVQPLRVHLGRPRLRDGARPPPGLPQEARPALPHPAGERRGSPARGWSRAGGSGRRARLPGAG